jgi:hypothetical protein
VGIKTCNPARLGLHHAQRQHLGGVLLDIRKIAGVKAV